MSTNTEPPVSFRLSSDQEALLKSRAAELGLTRHQLARVVVIQGLESGVLLRAVAEQVTAITAAMGELGEYLDSFREEFRQAVEEAKRGEG